MPNLINTFAATVADEHSRLKVTTFNDCLKILDAALAGLLPITTTGGTTTLDGTPESPAAQHAILVTSGALASNAIIEIPVADGTGRCGIYIVHNGNSGAHTTTFRAVGQTGVAVDQGKSQILYFNGTDLIAAAAAI